MERARQEEMVVMSHAFGFKARVVIYILGDRLGREPVLGEFISESFNQRQIYHIGSFPVLPFFPGRVYSISTGT